jgi:hypothetical protein
VASLFHHARICALAAVAYQTARVSLRSNTFFSLLNVFDMSAQIGTIIPSVVAP